MSRPRLHAPREHRGVLAVPPLAEAGQLLQANRARLHAARLDLHGRPLAELRRLAGEEVRTAARRYLAALGLSDPGYTSPSFLVTGHQPELFHPGVWVKNFAAHGLAAAHGATPLNLIVDNDTAKVPAVRVPVLGDGPARRVPVPFDRWAGPMPYEELAVRDEDLFARFPDEVQKTARGLPADTLLPAFWREVLVMVPRTPRLGERLAGARRRWEETWGCRTLELPVSVLCRTEAFAWFACHLLADLPRFREVYNDGLHAYRERHAVRTPNRPVPELAVRDDWREAPFWVWRAGAAVRERLFARFAGDAIELADAAGTFARLPRRDPPAAVRGWRALEAQGIKLRTRALTATLFARLVLADLFIHGIGGALYDELTDTLLREFYRCEPPGFLVLSATLLLPLGPVPPAGPLPEEVRRQLRDVWYNPDRSLAGNPQRDVADLRRQKWDWIRHEPADRAGRRERFRALRTINEQLREFVADRLAALRAKLAEAEKRRETLEVLQDREYAFCLYPAAELYAFYRQFLSPPGPHAP
jgi:hypothetical protein